MSSPDEYYSIDISDTDQTDNPYPVGDKWYWYDEAYSEVGPYDTKEEAATSLNGYCKWLRGETHGTSST